VTTPASAQADASAGGWIRTLVPLGFATTIVGLTGAFVAPFMALFLHEVIKASPAQTSLFLVLAAVSAIAVGNVVGRISDRPGARRAILVAGAISGIAGFAAYAVVRNYWALLLIALTLVAASGSLLPQMFAFGREVLSRSHPARAMMGVNALRMMLSLAWATGAPVAAALLGLIHYTGLFIATAVAHLAILGIVLTMRTSGAGATSAPEQQEAVAAAPAAAAEPARGILLGSAAAFVALQCVTSLTVTTMPLFVSVDLHSSVSSAGLVLGLCAFLELPLMMVFGSFAARFPLHRLIVFGGGFGIAYAIAGSLANRVWEVAAAQVLHACFVCAIGGLGISYFQELLPSALGRATTLFSNAGRLAGILAGVLFGVVEVHGYRLAFVASIGLSIAGTAILALTRRTAPRPARRTPTPAAATT
jgi:MFS transporter, SET family, sugar efflux transporter